VTTADVTDVVTAVQVLFASARGRDYLGEAVTMADHQLQAAALARAAGEPDALVAAALLHDVGHLLPGATDEGHGASGATWLARWFGEDVTEPVRLHVAAKRYLVATEARYAAELSPASVASLGNQGGPMDDDEVLAFRRHPHAAAAVVLRRLEDAAKDPEAVAPPLARHHDLLVRLVVS
jgi:gamma-butyrobetaine dioxygenase